MGGNFEVRFDVLKKRAMSPDIRRQDKDWISSRPYRSAWLGKLFAGISIMRPSGEKWCQWLRSGSGSLLLQSVAAGSVVCQRHINLLGEYDFSEEKLSDSFGINPPKILNIPAA